MNTRLQIGKAVYPQAGRGSAPSTPKAANPTDFTGYWVSVVTEDWVYRMVTPSKALVPVFRCTPKDAKWRMLGIPQKMKPRAINVRSTERLQSSGFQGACILHGTPDYTLKIETDAGTQTRLLNFREGRPAQVASGKELPQPNGKLSPVPATRFLAAP